MTLVLCEVPLGHLGVRVGIRCNKPAALTVMGLTAVPLAIIPITVWGLTIASNEWFADNS